MDIGDIIRTRRSIRKYADKAVDGALVEKVLEAGRWAPSGLSNQPWRFVIIGRQGTKDRIAALTHYSRVVRSAPVLIAVFLDTAAGYHRTKDLQAVGACIQNMLLEAHALGLGAVWLGEIIKSDAAIRDLLGLGPDLEMMAVIALGHPSEKPRQGRRRPLRQLVLLRDE